MPKPKPMLVGEQNPYGGDPEYALYPAPDGCAGQRLCCLILGMQRVHYLQLFERVNLCDGEWESEVTATRATELNDEDEGRVLILLGSKVARAFDLPYRPFEQFGEDLLVLPHPSGRCRTWNEPGAIERARAAVAKILPDLASFIGQERGA